RAVKIAYDAAVQRSSSHGEKLKQLKAIEDQLAAHTKETARIAEELRPLANAEATYQAERELWLKAIKRRDELLDGQCTRLTETSGGAIRAQLRGFANPADFVNNVRQSMAGSRVQTAKFDALGEAITKAKDPAAHWQAILNDLEKLAEFDTERE